MGKYRMYEPWGYQESNYYVSKKSAVEDDLSESKKNDKQELKDIEELKKSKVDNVSYDKNENKIVFFANQKEVASVDTTDFVKDGMIESVELDGTVLKIIFNTESGKEEIDVDFKDIISGDSFYTKDEVDSKLDEKADKSDIPSMDEYAKTADVQTEIANAVSGKADSSDVEAIEAQITPISSDIATLKLKDDELQAAVDLKTSQADFEALSNNVYTKEQVDTIVAEKESEIVKANNEIVTLKDIVGELGGNVEWGVPADGTFNNMMKKNGIVKLGEDTTTSTYSGGITSANKAKLNLNGKNLTFSGTTTNNPGIMARGKQEITIMGNGTLDAAGRIAVEANGEDAVINLSGTTRFFAAEPTYITDRSGGELIYCYLGTINITSGIFKNLGEDKKFLLNCYDANYQNGTAKIIVTGGKFYDFNPADNSAEGEHTNFVAEGYHVETSTVIEEGVEHTVYTVKKD
jgi:hypothetical protein